MRTSRVMIAAAVIGIAGCSDPIEPTLEATGELQVRPGMVRMITGQTMTLEAVAFDADGEAVFTGPLTWTSLDGDIVSVTAEGIVTAMSPGWARVVAEADRASKRDTAIIAVGPDFVDISGGDDVACGLTPDGAALCWGGQNVGHTGVRGTGSAPVVWTPLPVAGSVRFSAIAPAVRHTCALALDGSVYCWGDRGVGGSLAITTCAAAILQVCHTPERVNVQGSFSYVATNLQQTAAAACASGSSGTTCWGDWRSARPEGGCSGCAPAVISEDLVGPVAMGAIHACGLDAAGNAFCWGSNRQNQLGGSIPAELCGDAQCTRSTAPIPVNTSARFTNIVAGAYYTCGLTAQGAAYCWGNYDRFGSGNGIGTTPMRVGASLTFRSLDAGVGHVCGITIDDSLYCWGDNGWSGVLGAPLTDFDFILMEPREVVPGLEVATVGAGGDMTCAITTNAESVCIGYSTGAGQGLVIAPTTVPLPVAPPGPLPDYLAVPDYVTGISTEAARQPEGT